MPSVAAERMIILGRLGAPWGVKGLIKVESYTDPPEGLLAYPVWNVARSDGSWEQVRIGTGRVHGNGRTLVVALEGVSSPEDCRRFGTREVAMPRSALPPAGAGEYYWEDLLGCRAATLDGVELGVVSHFLDFPANAVMVLRDGARERWVPLVPRHLKRVDLDARQVTVDWDPEI
ncbi:MAG: ribosome maturation factor RimM [Pseudomonadota bacterium]